MKCAADTIVCPPKVTYLITSSIHSIQYYSNKTYSLERTRIGQSVGRKLLQNVPVKLFELSLGRKGGEVVSHSIHLTSLTLLDGSLKTAWPNAR